MFIIIFASVSDPSLSEHHHNDSFSRRIEEEEKKISSIEWQSDNGNQKLRMEYLQLYLIWYSKKKLK